MPSEPDDEPKVKLPPWSTDRDQPKKPTALQRKVRAHFGLDDSESHPDVSVLTPWGSLPPKEKARRAMSPMMRARQDAAMYADWYRDDVFASWSRQFLVVADDPREWTQAQVLYEHYVETAQLPQAGGRGSKIGKIAREQIATQKQWGLMMATKFIKKRRSKGWFYPVRLKRGA